MFRHIEYANAHIGINIYLTSLLMMTMVVFPFWFLINPQVFPVRRERQVHQVKATQCFNSISRLIVSVRHSLPE